MLLQSGYEYWSKTVGVSKLGQASSCKQAGAVKFTQDIGARHVNTYGLEIYGLETYGLDTYGLDTYGLDTYCLDTDGLDTSQWLMT
jgi:hypothetical protein